MFYDLYSRLCDMRGVSPSRGADEMNINRATVTSWKKEGFYPRQNTLEKLASYFAVPLAYLMGETTPTCPLCGGDTSDFVGHTVRHQHYEAAVNRFGLCWSPALCRQTCEAARVILAADSDEKTQYEWIVSLNKAHFSASLAASGYDLSHITFPTYQYRLIHTDLWEPFVSSSLLQHLRHHVHGSDECGCAIFPHALFSLPLVLRDTASPVTSVAAARPVVSEPVRFTGVIPILGQIAAGYPILAEENIEEYIPTCLPHPDEYFALRVHGDSMNGAGILDGDTVLIHKQDTARPGQIVACLLNGEEATLKRFSVNGDTILLLPENRNYHPIPVLPNDLETGKAKILGVAKEVTHPLL